MGGAYSLVLAVGCVVGSEGIGEQTLHMQVKKPKEIILRALEGKPGKKALCPTLHLRTQLGEVLPFLARRGKGDLH